uniref:Uncharacterized protein n=1 Tax=Candidatus Kentrum sp. LPFa TaxID=2126335 RepID=A0A450WGI8_9GAMM|nr:MAG: hypothetical protein BECKLPF1236B_GA0070989_10913 [Candidatus Kentron sp. LPFa]
MATTSAGAFPHEIGVIQFASAALKFLFLFGDVFGEARHLGVHVDESRQGDADLKIPEQAGGGFGWSGVVFKPGDEFDAG